MKIIRDPKTLEKYLRPLQEKGLGTGFVPTMGALHEGHLALVRKARLENDIVVVSIFVNPTQFGPKEDFKKYPRPFKKDCDLLRRHKADIVFAPDAKAVYPKGFNAAVKVDKKISNALCGKFRPGHFQGVANVVARLFDFVKPRRAYFGLKDYQQTVVIRRLVRDLDLGIELRLCPTVREKDGLAKSSRNQYLSSAERKRARIISQTLFWAAKRLRRGGVNLIHLKKEGRARLLKSVDRLDYFEIADPDTLAVLKKPQPSMVVLTACFVGKTRLIDNVIIAPQ
jgi:pantoate--beta-alanine ligase